MLAEHRRGWIALGVAVGLAGAALSAAESIALRPQSQLRAGRVTLAAVSSPTRRQTGADLLAAPFGRPVTPVVSPVAPDRPALLRARRKAPTWQPKPAAPHVIRCYATFVGALSGDVIRRIVLRHRPEIRYCYTQQLIAHPELEGRVTVRFLIGADGDVMASTLASSDLGSPSVESCIVSTVQRWSFPAVQGGGVVAVDYPFELRSLRP